MEQRWWKSGTSHGGTVEQLIREHWNMLCWNSGTEMVEQGNRNGGTVEPRWWNSGPADGGTVEQSWWNSRTSDVGTVEHMMVEQSNRDGRSVEERWWNS